MCFLVKMGCKKRFLDKKTSSLIFQPPLWWLDSRWTDDMSSPSVGDVSPRKVTNGDWSGPSRAVQICRGSFAFG